MYAGNFSFVGVVDMCWIWEAGCEGDVYAAWTQAIGSILALMVAIAIAYYQTDKEVRRREKEAKKKHLSQLKSIFFLANSMHQLLIEFLERLTQDGYSKPAYTESAGDLLNEIRLQPSNELNDEQRNSYFMLRRRFAEIFGHIHFGDENAYAELHIKEIHEFMETFRSYIELQSSN